MTIFLLGAPSCQYILNLGVPLPGACGCQHVGNGREPFGLGMPKGTLAFPVRQIDVRTGIDQ